ncbi:MAG: hypothetical protein ACLTT1_01780 [[Clostridium] scindens]
MKWVEWTQFKRQNGCARTRFSSLLLRTSLTEYAASAAPTALPGAGDRMRTASHLIAVDVSKLMGKDGEPT